jgi:nucleoside-triphosphatase THEP1
MEDTSRLLHIKGYYTEYESGSIHYMNFNSREKFLSLSKNDSEIDEESFNLIETKLINEISLFPAPDLFILDQVGKFECRSDRFCQQMLTLFESKIPVIIILENQQHAAYSKIINRTHFKALDMNRDNYQNTYQKLLDLLT